MRRHRIRPIALALLFGLAAGVAQGQAPQGTEFTFQGLLKQNGTPLVGAPNLEFRLFDSIGTPVGPVLTRTSYPVSAGLLSVDLDFGLVFSGQQRLLEITVNGTALTPRIPIAGAPYALQALSTVANSVNSASIVNGTIGVTDINPAQVQARISNSCSAGSFVSAVAADGTPTCSASYAPLSLFSKGFGPGLLTTTPTATSIAVTVPAGYANAMVRFGGSLSAAGGGIGSGHTTARIELRNVSGVLDTASLSVGDNTLAGVVADVSTVVRVNNPGVISSPWTLTLWVYKITSAASFARADALWLEVER